MPRRRKPKTTDGQRRLRLERQLALVRWLNDQFGFKSNTEMLEKCNGSEGRRDGESNILSTLRGRDKWKILPDDLARYDGNIARHLEAMNVQRSEPIALKYFQQLAALGTEYYLDCLFQSPHTLLANLNSFLDKHNRHDEFGEEFSSFTEADLWKVAFWMATGSGKTLLLHLNYRQFLHYFRRAGRKWGAWEQLDNILLLTPNERLSEQHMEEFTLSGIPARRVGESAGLLSGGDAVQVVEITKLAEQTRGRGASIPLERFDGRNLVFVDEGHKGSGGEKWFEARERVGRGGFTFEYSATFGQALFAAGGESLVESYGKSILFDYSYKYFHGDGFGKDFRVLNLAGDPPERKADLLMAGNLLSFYQQLCFFEEQSDALRLYLLERPLLLMLGSRVTGADSDVARLVGFLHRFIRNESGRAVKWVDKILKRQTGLHNENGGDVFGGKFPYLQGRAAETIYHDMMRRVFRAAGGGGALQVQPLKLAKGEIGLRVGENEPFGVISVGDAKRLCDLIRDDYPVSFVEDAMSDSLFARVNDPNSPINLLIGAKKFMEGWNSWRVAGMGLLNVGKSEGAEIIQLFGRGVRLRGRGMTLKRSANLEGEHPEHLKLLETLNIFAVRANFMERFRNYLEREGVDETELPMQTYPNSEFLHEGLFVPKMQGEFGETVVLMPNENIKATLDFSERLHIIESGGGAGANAAEAAAEKPLDKNSHRLLDWDDLFTRLMDHKDQRNWNNLLLNRENLQEIMEKCVRIRASKDYLAIESFAERQRLQDAAAAGLLKYADKLHHARERRWQADNMKTGKLNEAHGNFQDYSVFAPSNERELIEKLRAAIDTANEKYNEQWENQPENELHNIYFDRHLFQPLLLRRPDGKIRLVPPGLEKSERNFIERLQDFCRSNPHRLVGSSIFLLRNLPHRGVGFPDEGGKNFYPDFILWVKRDDMQRIVFVEPHGMRQEDHPNRSQRVKLYKWLADVSRKQAARPPHQPKLVFDSYIVSETPRDELSQKWDWEQDDQKFQKNHILFDGEDLIPTILNLPDSS